MSLSKSDLRTTYPLPVYNYRVEIGGETIAFSEVSGLSVNVETTTYKESPIAGGSPGPRVMHMPAQAPAVTITLKKGLVRGGSIAALYAWIGSIQTNLVDKRDVVVILCDENGDPVVTWKVINAFPTKLDAPTFDAESNDVAVETMELTADSVVVEEA